MLKNSYKARVDEITPSPVFLEKTKKTLTEAIESPDFKQKQPIPWNKILATAAMFCVVIAGTVLFLNLPIWVDSASSSGSDSVSESSSSAPSYSSSPSSASVPIKEGKFTSALLNQLSVKTATYPQSISFYDYQECQKVRTNNPVDSAYLQSVWNFSCRSASTILSGESGNANFSPLSLYMALSLAGTGANGTTQREIFSALGAASMEKGYLSTQTGNLFRLLFKDNEIGKLTIANSLWMKKGMIFNTGYMSNAASNFYASLFSVDFTQPNTGKAMGEWIKENTGGVLSPTIETDAETALHIINTVYFKDQWVIKFDANSTKPADFYLENSGKVQCDFLNGGGILTYQEGAGFQSVSLQLVNRGHMIFVLPDEGVSVASLAASPEKLTSMFQTQSSEAALVTLHLPKFSFGSKFDLIGSLKKMGITTAFDKKSADFTGITDTPIYLNSAQQQTHIGIDEEGVEAAAFTDLGFGGTGGGEPKKVELNFNRPFLYGIVSDGTLLFVGVCRNPADKN